MHGRLSATATGQTGLTTPYGDHLGSASLVVTGRGAVQRMRYPELAEGWGAARGTSAGAFATDRLFIG